MVEVATAAAKTESTTAVATSVDRVAVLVVAVVTAMVAVVMAMVAWAGGEDNRASRRPAAPSYGNKANCRIVGRQ